MKKLFASLLLFLATALPAQTVQGQWCFECYPSTSNPYANFSCYNGGISGLVNSVYMPPVIGQTCGLTALDVPSTSAGTWAVYMAVAHQSAAYSPPYTVGHLGITGGWHQSPGCLVRVPTDTTYQMPVPPWWSDYGDSVFTLAIPNDSYLVGEVFVFQVVVFNSTFGGGLGTSTHTAGIIGDY